MNPYNHLSIQSKFYFILSLSLFLSVGCSKSKVSTPISNQELLDETKAYHPEWAANATLYEVNVRQYSEEGTFKKFAESLPRLKEMGVDIIWFMPIHPIGVKERKGTLGSYYAVKDYKAVNPEFGTLNDFKEVVSQAHDIGLKVIIDWVANHSAPDHEWTITNPDFYQRNENGEIFGPFDWSDVAQLDYSNKELWKTMTAEMKFWVEETNIDGFRCDVAGLVPVEFWENTRSELEKVKPDLWMLAENEDVPALLNKAFNANYGWSIHALSNQIVQGEKTAQDLVNEIIHLQEIQPKGSYSIQFTTNHDENSWNGTVYERYGEAYKTMAHLMYTIPGMPLIYTGQESANAKRLEFFEKDVVKWGDYSDNAFYKTLNNYKSENSALNVGPNAGIFNVVENSEPSKIISFSRINSENAVFAVFNLSDTNTEVSLTWPKNVDATLKLSSKEDETLLENASNLNLEPWGFFIWTTN